MQSLLQNYIRYLEIASYLIGVIAFLVIYGVYYLKTKGIKLKSKDKDVDYSKHRRENSNNFVEIDDIKKDMAIEGDSRFTRGIRCIGFDYNNEDIHEQGRVRGNYISLFNSLEHPIQKFMTCKNVDVDFTLEKYQKGKEKIIIEAKKLEIEVNNLHNTLAELDDSSNMLDVVKKELEKKERFLENKLWQLEFQDNQIAYLKAISSPDNGKKQDVYYFSSYEHDKSIFREDIDKHGVIDRGYDDTGSKCRSLTSILKKCKVTSVEVSGNSYAELFRKCYNPYYSDEYKFKHVLESNFFDLVTTSNCHEIHRKKQIIDETLLSIEKGGEASDEGA
ncbi:MAG: hypothetical protein MJA82_18280 [Clostridia bacterium]|nr:hypothetical protein [Clostridia bacterium]